MARGCCREFTREAPPLGISALVSRARRPPIALRRPARTCSRRCGPCGCQRGSPAGSGSILRRRRPMRMSIERSKALPFAVAACASSSWSRDSTRFGLERKTRSSSYSHRGHGHFRRRPGLEQPTGVDVESAAAETLARARGRPPAPGLAPAAWPAAGAARSSPAPAVRADRKAWRCSRRPQPPAPTTRFITSPEAVTMMMPRS